MRRLPDCVYYISTAVVSIATAENTENATNNLIPHLLDRKGFYGNVIVSVNRGNKNQKVLLKEEDQCQASFWKWVKTRFVILNNVVLISFKVCC